jgi:aspartate kinase
MVDRSNLNMKLTIFVKKMAGISVFKFGGASVKDAEAIRNVGKIIKKYAPSQTLVVVSALGKTTNALENLVDAYYHAADQYRVHLQQIKNLHETIVRDLFPSSHPIYAHLNNIWEELDGISKEPIVENFDQLYDKIVSKGEMLSSLIVSHYLQLNKLSCKWIDARDIIRTDSIFREGSIQWNSTQENVKTKVLPYFSTHSLIITQGFIGSDENQNSVTLGREGSDFSAAIFSFCLDAEEMVIWKDVPGVLSADPRLFENCIKLDNLSYLEAVEMTYYGATVIHPKTIKPLQNKNIPLRVKSFLNPEGEGTLISNRPDIQYPPIVVVEKNQVQLSISPKDFSFIVEHHLAYLFQLFAEHRLFVNMMRNTAVSFSVIVTHIPDRIAKVIQVLEKEFNLYMEEDLELITIRHYHPSVVEELKKGKIILLEESIPKTIQMAVKDIPQLKRKAI